MRERYARIWIRTVRHLSVERCKYDVVMDIGQNAINVALVDRSHHAIAQGAQLLMRGVFRRQGCRRCCLRLQAADGDGQQQHYESNDSRHTILLSQPFQDL